ncbi:MAG TPA: S8 family serine peptidase [Chitinophagaceae bacterium]|nr:S8 family serine peptidase [Chitinophagaceae bacterium]
MVKKYAFQNDIYIVSAGAANDYDALAMANHFFETGLFVYAEPDLTLFEGLFTDPNDPLFNYQWSHTNTGSPIQYNGSPGTDMKVQQAWGISTGAGIKIAVIDEGVDTGHADLKANLLQGFDCLAGTANPGDGRPLGPARAHGTNCTGIISAVANNNIGIAGVAPDSKIIPINLSAANGNFTSDANIAAGFDYAWQNGADVISNSWGGGSPSNIIDDAISRAVTLGRGGKGTVVLFATGNNNAALSYPATNPNVISVGGVNMCGQRKSPASAACDGEGWGASYGIGLDVVAPCVKIVSTDISGSGGYNTAAGAAGDYFFKFNGTSSATPNTAAVVALILSANNNLTVSQVSIILESTCDKLPAYSYSMAANQPNGTWNNETGHGLVNAFNAVQAAVSGFYCNVQIQANSAARFCAGGSVGLSVINPVAGTSYQWRKDGINFNTGTTITASSGGSYDVMATAANGCMAIAAPILVTELTNTPSLSASAGIDTFICAGQSVKLGGNPAAVNGAPWLADKRAYGMDWMSNSFVKFSLTSPLQFDTIAQNVVSNAAYAAEQFFTGGDFTPYGYYALTQISDKLIKIDTATGVQQLIGIAPAPPGYQWSGMAWDPATKNLYGLAAAASGSSLCMIDPFTAAVTQVALVPVGLTEWLALSNNGYMYTMSDNNYVYSINKLTGAAVPLPNPVGADVIYQQDADFDPLTDNLYLSTIVQYQNYVSDLRTLNTVTGISSVIGSLGGLSEIDATGIAGPGYLYNWTPATGLNSTTVSVPVATPLTTTTYTLNVTDMCGNTASSQVTVFVSTPPPAVITAPADSICVEETVRLSTAKNSAYTYQWLLNGTAINGATDSFYVADAGGAYTVRIVNGACDSVSLPYTVKTCELRLNNNTAASLCATYFYDSGGAMANYSDGESFTKTITASTPGSLPQLTLHSFSTESGNDILTVYDGPDISSPVLAALNGTPAVPVTCTGVSGMLTIRFVSNAAIHDAGWAGTISCYKPSVYRSRASGNADDTSVWEVKLGSSFVNASTIPHVYDDSIIIQPGHTVTINTPVHADQVWVKPGAVLNIAAAFTLNDGAGTDLQSDGALVIGATGSINGNGTLAVTGTLDNTASVNSHVFVKTAITGTTPQVIAAGGSFAGLYISNPSVTFNMANTLTVDSLSINNGSGTATVTAVNPSAMLTINKKLGLQNGRLIIGNNAVLNLTPGAIVEGGGATSFVEGPVRCNTTTAGLSTLFFPVGKDVYRPVALDVTHLSAGLSTYQAEVFNTAPANRSLPATINAVSNKRYFKISNMGSPPVSNVVATLSYGLDDGVTDAASLRIAKDDGLTSWLDIGGTGNANETGTIRSAVNFTGFSDFVLANAMGGSNAFAVRWLQADAKMLGKQVQITWTIGNEVNIKNYMVERSADGISFTDLVMVNATAVIASEKQYEAADRLPEKGINYYRIRQTAKDGRTSYSKIIQVNVTKTTDFILWPNPAATMVNVQNRQPILRLQCFNSNGQLVYDARPSATQYTIPVQQWAAGIYQVKITGSGQVIQARFVKK